MPRLTDSMEEGTVTCWHKQVGDRVSPGEPLVEIETDKATMTYEADREGSLLQLCAVEGETVPTGAVIARLGAPAEPLPGPSADPGAADRRAEAKVRAEPGGAPAARAGLAPAARIPASPFARRLAHANGVDLNALTASGPRGQIVKADVERALSSIAAPDTGRSSAGIAASSAQDSAELSRTVELPAPSEEAGKGTSELVELSHLQLTVARRMAESKATIPHFYLEADVDMTKALSLVAELKQLNGEEAVELSINDLVIKACGLALRDFPTANASYADGALELHSRINVGIAVASHKALLVPTIFDVDKTSLGKIASTSRLLASRVRAGTITPPELAGGTFTISNLGMYGVRSFAPVINPPQAALLAVGATRSVVTSGEGRISSTVVMTATLACDHRVLYGAEASQFLSRVRRSLEQPLLLLL